MNVLLFGATGMVGMGVLLECLDSPDVKTVLVVGRGSCGVVHPKLTETLLPDLFDVSAVRDSFTDRDACFFTIGVTSVGRTEAEYHHQTCDLAASIARNVFAAAPKAVFVFVSGEGSDSSERGRIMWARVKGKAENAILAIGFRAAYVFRPGIIQPMRGVRSRTAWYRVVYAMLRPVTPMLLRIAPGLITTTVAMGRAMLHVVRDGYPNSILTTRDINRAASAT